MIITLFISHFLLISGLIIGLGAVTVIDWHGFLAQNSKYWTEATIRTHKVTKPLIWIGMTLHLVGLIIIQANNAINIFNLLQFSIVLILIINGLFLSLVVSPQLLKMERRNKIKLLPSDLQKKIFLSFIVSFVGWWSEVGLTVWYLIYLK